MPTISKEDRERIERDFQALSARLDEEGVVAKAEAKTCANIRRAADAHRLILAQSWEAAQTRVVYR